jgi:hypothetical protein
VGGVDGIVIGESGRGRDYERCEQRESDCCTESQQTSLSRIVKTKMLPHKDACTFALRGFRG